jgi:hypothetical protein
MERVQAKERVPTSPPAKLAEAVAQQVGEPQAAHPPGIEELNKILRMAVARGAELDELGLNESRPADGTSKALSLIQRASEAINVSGARAREMEARAEALALRAADEVKAALARVQRAEQIAREAELRAELAELRVQESEARANAAEQQAQAAGEELARLQASITEAFSRLPGR